MLPYFAGVLGALVLCASAQAQEPVEPLPPPAAAACVPACRSGFVCVSDRCVSACNPPCDDREQCTAAGECELRAVATATPVAPPVDFIPASPIDGAHRHDGFFVRLALGPGLGATGIGDREDDGVEVGFGGGGWTASLDVGGSRGDNFTLFGRLRAAWLVDPTIWVDDVKLEAADADAVQGLLGVGIAYFLMPLNLYLGAAVGMAVIDSGYDGTRDQSVELDARFGVGLDLEIGKEWWVADDWGLGLALRASFAGTEDRDDDQLETSQGAAFIALLFSATYQ